MTVSTRTGVVGALERWVTTRFPRRVYRAELARLEQVVGDRTLSTDMKAYVIEEPFGIRALRAVERPIPHPGPGQVLVREVALNYRDLMIVHCA